jgi:hypothetical protein
MKWLRTKYRDTFYPDERNGEAHVRGMKMLLGIRNDGQLFVAQGLADIVSKEQLRIQLDAMVNDPALASGQNPEAGKGEAGWVEEE